MRLWPAPAAPLGKRGEDIAAKALRRRGYKLLGRNVQLGRNEVDLIARDGDTIVFVEVKTRRSAGVAEPEDNITMEKQKRLSRAARIYMDRDNDPHAYYRFDVVSVVIPEKGRPDVTVYQNAFEMRR